MNKNTLKKERFIFVLGGGISGIGKGVITASIGYLLKKMGHNVILKKIDPYFNLDPGRMNPYEHGEVFVTSDGQETDLDVGHYERFTGIKMGRNSSITAGQINLSVLRKELQIKYEGTTVQMIPHITNEIKHKISMNADSSVEENIEDKGFNIFVVEIGGTIGDIESLPFIEAVRQVKHELGRQCLVIQVAPVIHWESTGEFKTKLAQISTKLLLSSGVRHDLLILRTEKKIEGEDRRKCMDKITSFCSIDKEGVGIVPNLDNPYMTVSHLLWNDFDKKICKMLKISCSEVKPIELPIISNKNDAVEQVRILIIGKYAEHRDSYISILESLRIAACYLKIALKTEVINASKWNRKIFSCYDGVLIAPGFGTREADMKIKVVRQIRERKIPFLGLCMGMEVACIEFIRNVCGVKDANSEEFDKFTSEPVFQLIKTGENDSKKIENKGKFKGILRKGEHIIKIIDLSSRAYEIYEKRTEVRERHRHRYMFNMKYKNLLEKSGMVISATSLDETVAEIVEIKNHPFFIGTQFHPEFSSTIETPHPIFISFLKSILEAKNLLKLS